MRRDKIRTGYRAEPYWSVQDEVRWNDLKAENPWLSRLPLRNMNHPISFAPWDRRGDVKTGVKEDLQ